MRARRRKSGERSPIAIKTCVNKWIASKYDFGSAATFLYYTGVYRNPLKEYITSVVRLFLSVTFFIWKLKKLIIKYSAVQSRYLRIMKHMIPRHRAKSNPLPNSLPITRVSMSPTRTSSWRLSALAWTSTFKPTATVGNRTQSVRRRKSDCEDKFAVVSCYVWLFLSVDGEWTNEKRVGCSRKTNQRTPELRELPPNGWRIIPRIVTRTGLTATICMKVHTWH